ncbi:exosome complex component RRP40-like [Polyodon spathula]|uniref:exosome complex component RRP40-like n=1 Tax=Polyodon spathula TaxID=7913 RepID=UPI001B7DDA1C|nr:exosome complex component RRP40-like [Polyodon spathula]
MPAKGESVIGIVTVKSGDVFKVDIGRSEQTSLSPLAFEGATKRNRPEYCTVCFSNTEVNCVTLLLLSPQSKIVKDLEKIFPFEMVIGVNGRIWVKT